MSSYAATASPTRAGENERECRYRGIVAAPSILLMYAFVIAGSACARDQQATLAPRHAVSGIAAAMVADPRPKAIRPEEQPFADLAQRVPSSAGHFVDQSGNLVMYVRDTVDFSAARLESGAIMSTIRARSPRTRLVNVVVRKGQYSFWQLATWRDAVHDQIIGRSSVISLDLEEQTNRVAVGVRAEQFVAERDSLMRWMAHLNIDTSAIRLFAATPVKFAMGTARSTASGVLRNRRYGASLQSDVDTIVGGMKFGTKTQADTTVGSSCTIGTVIDYGGVRSFLTASHCTKTMFAVDSMYAYRASDTGSRIGIETNDTPGFTCNYIYECRGSDAAIFGLYSPFNSAQSLVGLIARPESYSTTWGTAGSGVIDSSSPYFIIVWASGSFGGGETVDKVGYATGWTSGYITATCVDKISSVSGYFITCSMEASTYVAGGDSGSPILSAKTSAYDTDVNFAGTLWGVDPVAQRSYFSPVSRITNDFTSSMAVVRGTNLSTPSVSGTVSGNVPGISWSGISGATYYQVWRQWWDYVSGTGSSGWEYLGHQSSTFWDSTMNVDLYTGTTVPNFSTEGWVAYKVIAFNTVDRSNESVLKYFRLAP